MRILFGQKTELKAELYSEPCQTNKMELSTKIVSG